MYLPEYLNRNPPDWPHPTDEFEEYEQKESGCMDPQLPDRVANHEWEAGSLPIILGFLPKVLG